MPLMSQIKLVRIRPQVYTFLLGELLLFNIFYELTVSCTSIIAETPAGKLKGHPVQNIRFQSWQLFFPENQSTH